jgi:pyruvate dehydrogenase E1 component beta subunit
MTTATLASAALAEAAPQTDSAGSVEMTIRDAIALALREELLGDEHVFLMGEDIGAYGGSYVVTKGFFEEFGPDRVRDTPIAEASIVGAAIGAAIGGMRPIVELMTINFALLAFDQIVNHAAKLLYMSGGQVNVPIVLRMVTGGGSQLGAQHSQNLEAIFARVPGLRVVCPSTPYDALGMMRHAIQEANPYIFIEHSLLYKTKGRVPKDYYTVPAGKSVVRREGKDITLVGYARSAALNLEAAQRLAQQGVEAEVIDLRSLRPLDMGPVLASVQKTNRVLISEDAWLTGGFSSEVSCQIQEQAFDYLDAPVRRVNGADVPAPYNRELEEAAYPDVEQIIEAATALL